MRETPQALGVDLNQVLSDIGPRLTAMDRRDVAGFIDAGEYGVAADTLFCAIYDEKLAVDHETVQRLSGLRNLFNTFGDLDPGIIEEVLRPR